MDKNGWVSVASVLDALNITMQELELIVTENNKKRFEFNNDQTLIRARQGHSVNVDVGLKEVRILHPLYHGTAERFLDSIKEKGLLKGTRQHVHLTDNVTTAQQVGSRHGKPVVIVVDTEKMMRDGVKVYLSNNGVYLTDYVDPKYLSVNK